MAERRWLTADVTADALPLVRRMTETKLQLNVGISSSALTTFSVVLTLTLKYIVEHFPKKVGPPTIADGTGTGCTKVMAGSVVANISVGTFSL